MHMQSDSDKRFMNFHCQTFILVIIIIQTFLYGRKASEALNWIKSLWNYVACRRMQLYNVDLRITFCV